MRALVRLQLDLDDQSIFTGTIQPAGNTAGIPTQFQISSLPGTTCGCGRNTPVIIDLPFGTSPPTVQMTSPSLSLASPSMSLVSPTLTIGDPTLNIGNPTLVTAMGKAAGIAPSSVNVNGERPGLLAQVFSWEQMEKLSNNRVFWTTLMFGVSMKLFVMSNKAVFEWRRRRKIGKWGSVENTYIRLLKNQPIEDVRSELSTVNGILLTGTPKEMRDWFPEVLRMNKVKGEKINEKKL